MHTVFSKWNMEMVSEVKFSHFQPATDFLQIAKQRKADDSVGFGRLFNRDLA